MESVVEFHDWDGGRDLQLHLDHLLIGVVAVPYGRIDSVAIEPDDRGALVDLARLVISLGDDRLDLTLPVDDAERARVLIQVPEARSHALVDRAVFGPVDGPLLAPPAPHDGSASGLDSQPLLPVSLLESDEDLEGPLLAPVQTDEDQDGPLLAPMQTVDVAAPWPEFTAEVPLPPVELDSNGGGNGKLEVHEEPVPHRRRAGVLLGSALALVAGVAVVLVTLSHRSAESPPLDPAASHGPAPSTAPQPVFSPGGDPHPTLVPSPSPTPSHRSRKHRRTHVRHQAPASVPSSAPAPAPAPTPPPTSNPAPTTPPPAPPPPPPATTPPPPSPTISIG